MDMNFVFDGVITEFIGCAVDTASFKPAAGHPHAETISVVVSSHLVPAGIILDGVREQRWRILVGEDAHVLDQLVREDPEIAYEQAFIDRVRAAGHLGGLVTPADDTAQPEGAA